MPQAVVDPANLRRFAHQLKQFNQDLASRLMVLHGQLTNLGDTWRDQEHEKFINGFMETRQMLERFMDRRYDRCRLVIENSLQMGEWEKHPQDPGADPAGSQHPDHGALPGDDHAAVPSPGACLLQRRPGGGAGRAGGHVAPDGVEDPAAGLPCPDGGQTGSDPVDLAEGVVVDGREPELREPARGSRAHVSKAVPAVDDHRPGPVEYGCGLGGE